MGGNGLIFVGIPRERLYYTQFVDNRDRIMSSLHRDGRYCGMMSAEGHRVDMNRDRIVERYLAHPREPEWLLMLDTDMEHPDNIGQRLARWDRPLVGGLYFYRHEYHQPQVFRFTGPRLDRWGREIYGWGSMNREVYEFLAANRVTNQDGAFALDECEGEPLLECDAVGGGTMLVHREVLVRMAPPWFEYPHSWSSEDLEFCKRARDEQRVRVYADLSTVSGHFVLHPLSAAQFCAVYEARRNSAMELEGANDSE